jgi:hypothetical protein
MPDLCLIYVSPMSHLCLACLSPGSHLCLTCVSPVSHLCLTYVSPMSHPCITCVSPGYRLCLTYVSPVSHLCITCVPPVSQSSHICVSFDCKLCHVALQSITSGTQSATPSSLDTTQPSQSWTSPKQPRRIQPTSIAPCPVPPVSQEHHMPSPVEPTIPSRPARMSFLRRVPLAGVQLREAVQVWLRVQLRILL